MRKFFFLPFVIVIFCLTSCQATTTMTDKPSDYVYSLNKKIKIRDIEFKDGLGTLTVTHASVLKEEPFEIPMFDGYREDGTAIDSRNKKRMTILLSKTVKENPPSETLKWKMNWLRRNKIHLLLP